MIPQAVFARFLCMGNASGGDPSDYLIHWNGFADKTAALAFYAGDGITISNPTTRPFVEALYRATDHTAAPDGGTCPSAPVSGNPTTPYALYVSFDATALSFTIAISAALKIKYFSYDYWSNSAAGFDIALNYSGGETHSVVAAGNEFGSIPMERATVSAPGGLSAASYLTLITFTLDNCRMAWDNMLLKVS